MGSGLIPWRNNHHDIGEADGRHARPGLTTEQLSDAAPAPADIAELQATSLNTMPGASPDFGDVLRAGDAEHHDLHVEFDSRSSALIGR